MKTKTLIVGRSASGKDHLASVLKELFGWTFVKSYATRPKRTPGEDTHIFISQEDAKTFSPEQRCAETKIGEFEYFATKEQVLRCDGYVIDPHGAYTLIKKMPDVHFVIVYVTAPKRMRLEHAMSRGSDKSVEYAAFTTRDAAENEQFAAFEQALYENGSFGTNTTVLTYQNTYREDACVAFANRLNDLLKTQHDRKGEKNEE